MTRMSREYNLTGGDLYLQTATDKTIFRIHSAFFQRDCKSSWFLEREAGGSCSTSPLQVEHLGATEMADFLWVFYNPTYYDYSACLEKWTNILRVACQLGFPDVEVFAVNQINQEGSSSVVDRIALFRRCNVQHEHLVPLIRELCKRPEALNDREIAALGLETSLTVFRIREKIMPRGVLTAPVPAQATSDDDLNRWIQKFLSTRPGETNREKDKGVRRSSNGNGQN